jgi:hypothetical protein
MPIGVRHSCPNRDRLSTHERKKQMQTTPLASNEETVDVVLDLGDVADLTLGEGKSENEDKRKIYN